MKKIKLPNPTTLLIGSVAAFWIANIIHLSFNLIGLLIILLIPIVIFDLLYPRSELDDLLVKQETIMAEELEEHAQNDLTN